MEESKANRTAKTNETVPRCYYLDIKSKIWAEFRDILLLAKGTGELILHLPNIETSSEITLEKEIEYNFVVSYARVLPSELFQNEEHVKISKKDTQFQKKFVSLIIFKNLERERIVTPKNGFPSKEEIPIEERYLIFGFQTNKGDHIENSKTLSYLKRKISQANFRLRYHENGLKFQIKERVRYLTFKSMKQILITLAQLMGLPTNILIIHQLMKLYEETEPQKIINQIINRPEFFEEIRSIVYKTIISYGLFPSFVEINTMGQGSVISWLQKVMSSAANAPWSLNYHASFSLGNHRYSFVHVPDDESLQNKVNVTLDTRSRFTELGRSYIRFKFFDFFPMNSWMDEIAAFIQDEMNFLKILEFDNGIPYSKLTENIEYNLGRSMDGRNFPRKIANEFYERYKEIISSSNEEGFVFLQFTNLIADAEIRGYNLLSNSAQTLVAEIVNLFGKHLKEFVEPLHDVETYLAFKGGDPLKDFNIFSSHFNKNFEIQVKPFPLTHRLSYFNTYTDIDTYNHLKPENYKNLEKLTQLFDNYIRRGDVEKFLGTIKKSYPQILAKLSDELIICKEKHENQIDNNFLLISDIEEAKMPTRKPNQDFSFLSHLIHVLGNKIFNLRRESKIKKKRLQKIYNEQNRDEIRNEIEAMYQLKYEVSLCYREVCYYYFNSIRLGCSNRNSDTVSYIGLLLIKNPDKVIPGLQEKDENSQLVNKPLWKARTQLRSISNRGKKLERRVSFLTECYTPPGRRPQKFQSNSFKGTTIRENNSSIKYLKEEKRQLFQTNDKFPYSAIGLLKVIIDKEDPITGTGILVGPNLVLTAAHNIIDDSDKFNRKCYADVEFIPAMNEGMAPFGTCKVIDSFVPEEFKKTGEKEDYALLVLDREVGNEAGYFGIHATDYPSLKNLQNKKQEVFVLGYPGYVLNALKQKVWLTRKGIHQLWGMGSDEWIIEADPKNESFLINYQKILTSPGQSGSGVYYKSGNGFHVLGIHVIGSDEMNTATWITTKRFERIQNFAGSRLKGLEMDDGIEALFLNATLKGDSLTRIIKELRTFFKDPIPDIFFDSVFGNQIFGRFNGPDKTSFEGGVFEFVVEINDYPLKPPKFKLLTKVYHPNIDNDGFICMDILFDNWTPVLTVPLVVLSIVSLLGSPEANEPLSPEIGRLYLTDKQRYEAIAKEWTIKYATPKKIA